MIEVFARTMLRYVMLKVSKKMVVAMVKAYIVEGKERQRPVDPDLDFDSYTLTFTTVS
jgi:hypothetical protein